jgi:hypothetical protein
VLELGGNGRIHELLEPCRPTRQFGSEQQFLELWHALRSWRAAWQGDESAADGRAGSRWHTGTLAAAWARSAACCEGWTVLTAPTAVHLWRCCSEQLVQQGVLGGVSTERGERGSLPQVSHAPGPHSAAPVWGMAPRRTPQTSPHSRLDIHRSSQGAHQTPTADASDPRQQRPCLVSGVGCLGGGDLFAGADYMRARAALRPYRAGLPLSGPRPGPSECSTRMEAGVWEGSMTWQQVDGRTRSDTPGLWQPRGLVRQQSTRRHGSWADLLEARTAGRP